MQTGDEQAMREAFVATCRQVAAAGLVRASSGNLSLRVGDGRMLVSASRSWLGTLTDADVSVCAIEDGQLLAGRRASVETAFHAGILRARPEVNVVLHFQAPYATMLACRRDPVNYDVIPEVPSYLGPIARVPYLAPGSAALAEAVIAALRDHSLAQLDHHGQVTAAATLDGALQNALFFELACQVIVCGGAGIVPLAPAAVQALAAARVA